MLRRSALLLSVVLPLAGLAGLTDPAFAATDVVVALDNNVIGLDPADLNDNLSMTATRTMLQGLYGFDKDMKMIPVLAEGYEASPDATVFTVHLKKGIVFHDGAPFNALAVKTSFDRAANPDNHLKRASLYAPIKSTEVVDDYTVKITLNAPFGAFINNLAHQAFAISSPKAIAEFGKDLGRHPVGTGPYKFASWPTPDTVKVVKNEHYWKPGLPKVDSITIRSVSENGARLAMLQAGEAQYIYPMPPELTKVVEKDPKIDIVAAHSIYARYVALNTLRKPFSDVRVRQALNYAVDKNAYMKVVFGGYAVPMDAPLPTSLPGYAKQTTAYPHDVAKAKALLAEAGYPNGFETVLWGGNSTISQRGMQFLQQQLAAIGVKASVEPLESGTAASKIWNVKTPEEATTLMHYAGWSASTGDADWGLRPLFYGKAFPPVLFNTAYYSNPQVNADIEAGLTTADAAKRMAAYKDAQAQIWKDAPWIFLASDDNISAKVKKLSGIYVLPDGQMLMEEAAMH
jgi:glutathione transport system substrate-binding protein